MKLRTRFLPRLLNSEVEAYLQQNDLIIIPVGTVEMHGAMPLDCETVLSEAAALKMAEACDGLVLSGLPYFYAGATATGRGTTQVSVRQGIEYLGAIARSLLRQGFRRQIYVSLHGPAYLTCSPMVRDFFDETGVPALYVDLLLQLERLGKDFFPPQQPFYRRFDALILGAYDLLGRLEDVPLCAGCRESESPPAPTVAPFQELFSLAYQSGSAGYCFGAPGDHMPTVDLPSAGARRALAEEGKAALCELIRRLEIPRAAEQLAQLADFEAQVGRRFPWTPPAWNAPEK
ncbi:creatininase family protein [Anaerofilum hominis]|uniref:creatininase family protein n=1 Tax=Anaerofilum hominis TaxID=2763016 RepID=UPI00311AA409